MTTFSILSILTKLTARRQLFNVIINCRPKVDEILLFLINNILFVQDEMTKHKYRRMVAAMTVNHADSMSPDLLLYLYHSALNWQENC